MEEVDNFYPLLNTPTRRPVAYVGETLILELESLKKRAILVKGRGNPYPRAKKRKKQRFLKFF